MPLKFHYSPMSNFNDLMLDTEFTLPLFTNKETEAC